MTKDRDPGLASPVPAIAALLGAMISLQYGATLGKGLFAAIGAEGTTALRLAAAALILVVVQRPWRVRLSWRILPALAGYGATLAVMNLTFYLALRTIPLGVVSALQFFGPLLVAALSSRRRIDFAWIGLAVLGIALLSPIIDRQAPLDPVGVMLALAAGACWALYIVFGQKIGRELGPPATALGMAVAGILTLPVGIEQAGAALLDPSVLLSAAVIGALSGALPFALEMRALTRLPARAYGTLTSLEPVIGALMGFLLLGESLTAAQGAGIVVIVAAALGTALTLKMPAA